MLKKLLPIAALSLLGLSVFGLARQGEAAKFLAANISKISIDKSGTTVFITRFNVTVTLSNPSPVDIAFDSMNAKLYIDSTQVGSVLVQSNGVVLRKYADTSLTFPLNMQNGAVANKLVKWLTNPQSVKIASEGMVYSGALAIPYSTSYVIPVKNAVSGIAGPSIGKHRMTMEFETRQEMEDYFNPLAERQVRIPKL